MSRSIKNSVEFFAQVSLYKYSLLQSTQNIKRSALLIKQIIYRLPDYVVLWLTGMRWFISHCSFKNIFYETQ